MSSIDERIVRMKFDNAAFQQGIQQTIASLEKFNKALQLQGATKGLTGALTVAQQFNHQMTQGRDSLGRYTSSVTQSSTATQQLSNHMTQGRDSAGRFTTSVSQSSTVTTSFGQKLEAGKESLSRFSSGFSSIVSHFGNFGQKVGEGRDSLGRFVGGLGDTSGAAKNADSSVKNLGNGVSAISERFSALKTVATGALLSIGARAQESATQMLNSFTFGPIMTGFREYETNMTSIQTILANTAAQGTTLDQVTHALEELNHYSDQTIYNFAEMAKNIGQFTAAGVDLETSVGAIKGIANLAAMSGTNSERAAAAMYQLSQAISSGTVSLEDWNSVEAASMGGAVFKKALADTAVAMGKLKDGAVKLVGPMKNIEVNGKSFRNSISAVNGKSWLDSEVLTATLQQFTGDLTDADLAAQGFSKSQIKAIQKQAEVAKKAATEVKTLSGLFDTTKEALGSGWSQTWKLIFGDFLEAKGLFTGLSDSIGKLVEHSATSRNKMLSDWRKFGGRDALIEGISNSVKAFGSILKPIGQAFREIFPATTGKQLADISKNFRDFTAKLKIGSETADKLKRTFAGVFAIFGVAWDVIKGVVGVIFDLVGVATKGSGGILNFTAKIGDFLVAIRNGIKQGDGLTNFFKGLGAVLAIPIKLIQKLGAFIGSLFKDTDSKGVEKSVEGISSKLEPLGRLGDVASAAWEKTLTIMKNVADFFKRLGKNISDAFSAIGIDMATLFEGFDFKTLFAGLNTGMLAGLFIIIKNFLGGFGGGGLGGILDTINDGIGDLTDTFGTMQNTLQAATLLQIALAVGVLAVSMNVLSKIDREGLIQASSAITVMFAQLLGSMAIFQKFIGAADYAKLPFVMGSLILLAAAIVVLTQAVEDLSKLSWNELAKGLTGVTVLLGGLFAVLKFMPSPTGMISTGLGLIALAAAIKILASAVNDMSGLGWNELAKGLVGVGALLGALILFTKFAKVEKGGLAQGAGIILLAAGIKILASAVSDMSKLSWEGMAKGLVGVAGALVVVGGALKFIPPTAVKSALGVLLVSLSLKMVAKALEEMAKMSWAEIGSSLTVMGGALALIAAALYFIPPTAPLAALGVLLVALSLKQIAEVLSSFAEYSWEEIGKSMTLLAGTLTLITAAMMLMSGAIPGALATIVVAGALAILAPVLMQFSQMSLSEIGTSLLMLAGVFAVFGAAAYLLAPVVPVMMGLGVAVALLGVGLLAAGAGVLLFAAGLTALAASGAAATAMIVGIVAGLIGLIPTVMEQIGLGLIAFAKVIATAGPAITKAITVVLLALIAAIVKITPKAVDALLRMLLMMITKMSQYIPKMVTAGMALITGILNGISKNIGKMATAATNVVVKFLDAVGKNLPRVIEAGVKLIISFINGVTKTIDSHSAELGAAAGRLGIAIIQGIVKGIGGGIGEVASAAKRVAKAALDAAKDFLGVASPSKEFQKIGKYVVQGFRKGIDGDRADIDEAFETLEKKLKDLSKSTKASAAERKKAASAYTYLTKNLRGEQKALETLADRYDKFTDKLKKAEQALADIKKTREDFRKQVTDQYSVLPDITAETKVSDYKQDLKTQIEKTKQFANTLQRLRDLGLNDVAYKQLLSKGIDALPFANELLAGGRNAVSEINSLDKQLATVAGSIGKSASSELYDAAVNAAAGFVKGLRKQQKELERQMDILADVMVKAIRKKLGIKSPSTVFAEIGGYSAEGIVQGLGKMSGSVAKAAEDTGETAIDALRKSMSGFSNLIAGPVDIRPTITPVLDLSAVKKNAGRLGTMLSTRPISVDSAYSKAVAVYNARMASQEVSDIQAAEVTRSVTFNQYNNSPKALSSAEIYRQTNNQLSRAKGALSTNANKSGR